jgi:hypothetical protein
MKVCSMELSSFIFFADNNRNRDITSEMVMDLTLIDIRIFWLT